MVKYTFYKISTMFSHRNGTMGRDFLPRAKTWKTVRRTRNKDAAHAHKRVTAPSSQKENKKRTSVLNAPNISLFFFCGKNIRNKLALFLSFENCKEAWLITWLYFHRRSSWVSKWEMTGMSIMVVPSEAFSQKKKLKYYSLATKAQISVASEVLQLSSFWLLLA